MEMREHPSPEEIARCCGSPRQLARITASELCEGRERGVRCLDFRTGSGFNFTVVPDRGMDIAYAEFRGRNLSWLSSAPIAAPQFYAHDGVGWLRSFFGGLLTTCGLVHVGAPDTYQGEPFGLHGRISNTPAHHVSHDEIWAAGEYFLMARGLVREARPMLYNLLMKRSIQTKAGEKCLRVHDVMVNEGCERIPLQVLYHVNVGYPVLDKTAYFLSPSRMVTPRDPEAADAKEHYKFSESPMPKGREKVYYHDIFPAKDGRCWAAVINPDLDDGLGVYVKYKPDALPLLTQWKMMAEGTYVMGMEPCNTHGLGFERQRSLDMLRMIEPGEHVDFYVEIGVLSGRYEIEEFESQVAAVAPPVEPEFGSVLT